jgi:V-type H+-transporting ATPase subunit E
VVTLAKDNSRYVQFLEGIIVQGYLQILEAQVTVHSRKRDVELVKQAAGSAARTYKDISGRDINYSVEGTLSDDGYVVSLRCRSYPN